MPKHYSLVVPLYARCELETQHWLAFHRRRKWSSRHFVDPLIFREERMDRHSASGEKAAVETEFTVTQSRCQRLLMAVFWRTAIRVRKQISMAILLGQGRSHFLMRLSLG